MFIKWSVKHQLCICCCYCWLWVTPPNNGQPHDCVSREIAGGVKHPPTAPSSRDSSWIITHSWVTTLVKKKKKKKEPDVFSSCQQDDMNGATADNNGVYLLDGCHDNGCRQSEKGGRKTECRSVAVRSVPPNTSAPLLGSPFVQKWTVYTPPKRNLACQEKRDVWPQASP